MNADAADISGQAITGKGTVNVTNVEADTDVDLSTITTTNLNAAIDASTTVEFGASSHFGDATVTVSGDATSTSDVVTFAAGADLSAATFVVSTGATLGLSLTQAAALSATSAITGAGDVVITMPEGTGSFVETALIKVDLEGGNLTLDLGADDNDTLILASGSSIDLGGGILTISDGTVDVLTNAADFSNVSDVVINSAIILSFSDFSKIVTISGTGNAEIVCADISEINSLAEVIEARIEIADNSTIPQFSVKVVSEDKSDSELVAIDNAMADLGGAIALKTGINVETENSSGIKVEQFTLTEANGSVSFGGAQTGNISVNVKADGSASFSRGNVESYTTVSNLSAVDLDVPASS